MENEPKILKKKQIKIFYGWLKNELNGSITNNKQTNWKLQGIISENPLIWILQINPNSHITSIPYTWMHTGKLNKNKIENLQSSYKKM